MLIFQHLMNLLPALGANAGFRLLALGISAPTIACLFSMLVCRLNGRASAATRHLIWMLAFVIMAVSAPVGLSGMRVAIPILPSAAAAPVHGVSSPRLPEGMISKADPGAATGTPRPMPPPSAVFATPIPRSAAHVSYRVPWQFLILSS